MWSRRRFALAYISVALAAVAAMVGCRAFEPETVIVNKPPETYIIGAPAEEAGGYYHYHVFWYGTDSDGRVERYVWALTDSTVQDEETLDDEEDSRFNPFLNITTLDIGRWTTKTDSIFDFMIEDGPTTSVDKTFHIVAVDDRGDYDRTPARLYFLSNALGTPAITFYGSLDRTPENLFANADTIAYGRSFVLSWRGSTPNIRSYIDFADADTVGEEDGLYGFKFRLPNDVDCDDAIEDCWNPREFDDTVNDSVSFFGGISALEFDNGESGDLAGSVYRRRLVSGVHSLLVNTIDLAGVEVPRESRSLDFVINYDPDTRILRGETDPFNPSDPLVYPYYTVFRADGTTEDFNFAEGDTLPHRSRVVFKAVGKDDSRDVRLEGGDFEVLLQGQFEAVGAYKGDPNSPFRFASQYSELGGDYWTEIWDNYGVGSADTISFVVGPFQYAFNMRSSDEHGRRDGTADSFDFYGNFPPVVQCVEAVPSGEDGSFASGACSASIDTLYAAMAGAPPLVGHPTWRKLPPADGNVLPVPGELWFNPQSGFIGFEPPASQEGYGFVDCLVWEYELLLHGVDHPQEQLFIPGPPTYGNPQDRMFSWRYQVTSSRDSIPNAIRDGGGVDDISQVNYDFSRDVTGSPHHPIVIDDDGVWRLRIRLYTPQYIFEGEETYRAFLSFYNDLIVQHPELLDAAVEMTTRQLGLTTALAVARDVSNCTARPDRCRYIYYSTVRVPEPHSEADTFSSELIGDKLALDLFGTVSDVFQKQFVLKIQLMDGSIYPPIP